jgi:glucose-1-phosphate cytidylyltransferase
MAAEYGIFDYLDGDNCVLEEEPFRRLSLEGKMAAYRHYGYWQCMDTARDKGALEAAWAEGSAKWKVWKD